MRMWGLDPKKMCKNHLLGEHVEMHMFVGALNKNKSLQGYIEKGLVEIHNIDKRHEELVEEMNRRGINHNSPLPQYYKIEKGHLNKEYNLSDLTRRCAACRQYWVDNTES